VDIQVWEVITKLQVQLAHTQGSTSSKLLLKHMVSTPSTHRLHRGVHIPLWEAKVVQGIQGWEVDILAWEALQIKQQKEVIILVHL
jgi:hypothetical protein